MLQGVHACVCVCARVCVRVCVCVCPTACFTSITYCGLGLTSQRSADCRTHMRHSHTHILIQSHTYGLQYQCFQARFHAKKKIDCCTRAHTHTHTHTHARTHTHMFTQSYAQSSPIFAAPLLLGLVQCSRADIRCSCPREGCS